MWRRILFMTVVMVLVFSQQSWSAARISIGEGDSYLDIALLGQLHSLYCPDADDETDFYLRRGRIILSGQITDGVKFFVETDNDNAGKSGGGQVSTDIQDIYIDLRLFSGDLAEGWVKAGLIIVPLSFENRASATSLLGLDYNVEIIKLPHTFVWRDYGVEFHGSFGHRFAWFLGVFDGYDEPNSVKNPESSFRYTGHLAFNVLGNAETSWFFTQERLGKSVPYLSLGVGFDRQEEASRIQTSETPVQYDLIDSEAFVVDLQSGFAIDPVKITANAAWYQWDNYLFEGNTAFLETGFMLSRLMLTTKYSLQDPDEGDSITDYTAGLHYFIKNHNARIGIEYRWGDSPETTLLGIQFLL